MKSSKCLMFAGLGLIATSCQSVNIGFRSNIHTTIQHSSTEGKIENQPKQGDERIDASKETQIQPNINTNKEMPVMSYNPN